MNKLRKETIIHEIKYWKESRLLPENYCDYLLALYTEGEKSSEKSKPYNKNLFKLFLAFLIPMFIPITFLVIYFTELSIDLQMVLMIFFIFLSFFGYYIFRKEHFFVHIPIIVIVLLVLLLSLKLVELMDYQSTITLIVVGVQTLIWFVIGYIKKWYYLTIISILSIALMIGVIILM
ncbi:hypothetical protein [Sutcliffiella halmapala]|uniref:hypothetical protein n=1 Tax=Sutcliffiella halmapala TaxID=79882 RepID=UPI0009957CB5|nr:hypothetical protein [Sutcliffiella halmapala]